MMTEYISVNPNICHGQACIKGTRIPVHQIIRMLANGDQVKQLLEDYPSLKTEDIYLQVFSKCSALVLPYFHHKRQT